jgi:hypothetical protein
MAILPAAPVGVATQRLGVTRRGPSGFAVPEGPQTKAAAPLLAAGLDAFLSLQEVEAGSERDRRARRHGQSLLDILGRLQHALLGSGDAAALLRQLHDLARDVPVAEDAALRCVVEAISLRAHVELALRAVACGDGGAW